MHGRFGLESQPVQINSLLTFDPNKVLQEKGDVEVESQDVQARAVDITDGTVDHGVIDPLAYSPEQRRRVYVARPATGKLTRKPHKHIAGEEEGRQAEDMAQAESEGSQIRRSWRVLAPAIDLVGAWDSENMGGNGQNDSDHASGLREYTGGENFKPTIGRRFSQQLHAASIKGDPKVFMMLMEGAGLVGRVIGSTPREAQRKGFNRVVHISELTRGAAVPADALDLNLGEEQVLSEEEAFGIARMTVATESLLTETSDKILSTLPASERMAIRMSYRLDGKGRSEEEIALELGCTVKEANRLVIHALRRLRYRKSSS